MMISAKLMELIEKSAGRTLTLRGAIVAINFLVMMGLAAGLGLDAFGRLVFFWGTALVAGTVLSVGGPLILLRDLTDGGGMRFRDVILLTLVLPALLSLAAVVLLTLVWPSLPWHAIVGTGFAINALTCLASVMRALGSVQWSMALRDAGPQVALGVATFCLQQGQAAFILMLAAGIIAVICIGVTALFWRAKSQTDVFSDQDRRLLDLSLWGTSVLGMGVTQMDLIVGGAFLAPEALGVYAVLRRIANLVALPVTVATWVSAAPVSAAHGRGNMKALQQASAAGSRIALLPGAALFLFGLTAIPIVVVFMPGTAIVFAILLVGAFIQVVFASGYTVATLCAQAHLAVGTRLAALGFYLAFAQLLGAQFSPIANAIAYIAAMSGSSLLLWVQLKRKTGIETSAYALRRTKVGAWKAS